MSYRDEYVAHLKAELGRCNSRITRCAQVAKTAAPDVLDICKDEMRSLRERRRKALGRLRVFART